MAKIQLRARQCLSAVNVVGQLGLMFATSKWPPPPPENTMRGFDFYPWRDFLLVIVNSALNFKNKHGYMPSLASPTSFNEHIFARKFFAPLPMPAPALPNLRPDFVGKDVRKILKDRLCRDRIDQTAFVDLVMGHLSQSGNNKRVALKGAERDKYFERARIFAEEADKIIHAKGTKGNDAHVLVIGASEGIISALVNLGFEVSATDLSPALTGTVLGGVNVCDGRFANASLMKKADLAIITGMTLANGTLLGLMKLAQRYNTSTMIWAITGKNFGQYYTEHGVDCVISDLAAFHRLLGPSSIGVWRREL